jgi:hypothetical protein
MPLSARAQELLKEAQRDTAFTDEREVRAFFDAMALEHPEQIVRAQVAYGGYSYRFDQAGVLKLGMTVSGDVWDNDPTWEEEGSPLRVLFGDHAGDPSLYFLDTDGRVWRDGLWVYTSLEKMIEDHAMAFAHLSKRPFFLVRLRAKPGVDVLLQEHGLARVPDASDERVSWWEGKGLTVNLHPFGLQEVETWGVRIAGRQKSASTGLLRMGTPTEPLSRLSARVAASNTSGMPAICGSASWRLRNSTPSTTGITRSSSTSAGRTGLRRYCSAASPSCSTTARNANRSTTWATAYASAGSSSTISTVPRLEVARGCIPPGKARVDPRALASELKGVESP